MKNDRIEDFIRDHREEFDSFEPSPEIWDRVKKREPFRWQRIAIPAAAAVTLLLGSWYLFSYLNSGKQYVAQLSNTESIITTEIRPASEPLAEIVTGELKVQNNTTNHLRATPANKDVIYPELAEVENYYRSIIYQKENELYHLTGNSNDIKTDLSAEFKELDKAMRELKEDLKENVDNEQVIEAMIQNYRVKVEILENILNQVRSTAKNETKEGYEI
jgi:predicted phage-related endonuclease